jgi:elongation of very long chain fatty acids protein 4
MEATLQNIPTEFPDSLVQTISNSFDSVFGRTFDSFEATARDLLSRSNITRDFLANVDWFLKTQGNTHAKKLPLMNPFDVLLILLIYLGAVLFLRKIMEFLPSFKDWTLMKVIQIFHNMFLVGLSVYMSVEIVRQATLRGYNLWFNGVESSKAGWPMAKIIWVFYISKIYEFGDTIIMLLRKNFQQVSFLHVYHHFTIFFIWWLVTFLAPGGDSYFSAALNSLVHVIMYAYYLCTSLSLPFPFKYYITYFQMAQFMLNFMQAGYDWYFGIPKYPKVLCQLLLFYMVSLLVLFANFLIQSKASARTRKNQDAKKRL